MLGSTDRGCSDLRLMTLQPECFMSCHSAVSVLSVHLFPHSHVHQVQWNKYAVYIRMHWMRKFEFWCLQCQTGCIHPWHGISGVRSWRATPKRARSFYCSPPCSNKSFPMDPGSPKLRMVMEPKYYAFRRWLETPIISWEYNWIPRDREWNWKSYLAMVVVWSVKTSWYHSPRSSHHTVESKHFNLNPCFQMKKMAGCFGLHWDISTDLLVLYPSYHGMNITTKSPFRSI